MNIAGIQLNKAGNRPKSANKIIIHGLPGTGKTSLFAHAPSPLIIPAQGEESGIAKLAESGLIPESTVWAPEIKLSGENKHDGWENLLRLMVPLVKEEHPFKTVVFDCFDEEGFLDMAYHHHGDRVYGGDMGPEGFEAFGKGYQSVLGEIKRATHNAMTALVARGIDVVLLMHSTTANYKNPDSSDYHRHVPLCNQKHVWPLLSAWADMVLFLSYETIVVKDKDSGRGKAKGGKQRLLHCAHSATHEAKNRHGLPDVIKLPDNPAGAFEALQNALKGNS